MNIQRLDPGSTELILACHQVYLAAQQADRPGEGYLGPTLFRQMVTVGWQPSVRQELWTATNSDGTVTGCYILYLPQQEN
jgi:hypothetical protein